MAVLSAFLPRLPTQPHVILTWAIIAQKSGHRANIAMSLES